MLNFRSYEHRLDEGYRPDPQAKLLVRVNAPGMGQEDRGYLLPATVMIHHACERVMVMETGTTIPDRVVIDRDSSEEEVATVVNYGNRYAATTEQPLIDGRALIEFLQTETESVYGLSLNPDSHRGGGRFDRLVLGRISYGIIKRLRKIGIDIKPSHLNALGRMLDGLICDESEPSELWMEKIPGLTNEQRWLLHELYPGGLEGALEQSPDVGDCYFVATLYALRNNPIFPYLLARMVQKDDDGNFLVNFLGNDQQQAHRITEEDMHGQKIVHRDGSTSFRSPLKGQRGDVIIERAFARLKKLDLAKRSGWSNGLKQRHLTQRQYTMAAVDGYNSNVWADVMRIFLGKQILDFDFLISTKNQKEIESILVSFGVLPQQWILTAGTPQKHETQYFTEDPNTPGKKRYYMDEELFFEQSHAYTIVHVDAKERFVTVVDPHNTATKRKTISFDEFLRVFEDILGARLNMNEVNRMMGKRA